MVIDCERRRQMITIIKSQTESQMWRFNEVNTEKSRMSITDTIFDVMKAKQEITEKKKYELKEVEQKGKI